jgi:hypothetical protein
MVTVAHVVEWRAGSRKVQGSLPLFYILELCVSLFYWLEFEKETFSDIETQLTGFNIIVFLLDIILTFTIKVQQRN